MASITQGVRDGSIILSSRRDRILVLASDGKYGSTAKLSYSTVVSRDMYIANGSLGGHYSDTDSGDHLY